MSRPSLTALLTSALLLVTIFKSQAVNAMTLDEIYGMALQQSEVLQTSQIDINIAGSERDRALTLIKPRVALSADGTYHINKYDKESWDDNLDSGVRTEFRQPLYDGGVSSASIAVAKAGIETSKWDYKTNEQNLYLQITNLFYELIAQNKDLINLEETIKIYKQRVGDLNEREKIGRSREAEVLAARTQLELTNSMIVATKINIGAAEEQLAWLSGQKPPLKLEDNLDVSQIQNAVIPSSKALLPSVEAAQARVNAAEAQIDLVRTGLNPSVDFIAAHNWRYQDASQQGYHDFAIGLGLNWTLYDAGSVNAAVTTASLQKSRATVQKQLADREGDLNFNIARRKLNDSLLQIKTYRSALDVVERTLKSQQSEFASGLITNLELLTTLDQRLEIRRNIDQAIYRAKLLYVQTQVYAGATVPAPPAAAR
jgi:outer membrane protein TolC